MNEDFLKIIKEYRDSKIKNLMMFNWTIAFVTIVVGIINILKDLEKTKVVIFAFSENKSLDILFSLLFVSLGILAILYINKIQIYKIVILLLTAIWFWIYLTQLFLVLSQTLEVEHILIIPIIVQSIYLTKESVFLYEDD